MFGDFVRHHFCHISFSSLDFCTAFLQVKDLVLLGFNSNELIKRAIQIFFLPRISCFGFSPLCLHARRTALAICDPGGARSGHLARSELGSVKLLLGDDQISSDIPKGLKIRLFHLLLS